ncbi:MAG: hypothetical protein GY765_07095 [bacterium]|nr:hypothetical protein [bacterium]
MNRYTHGKRRFISGQMLTVLITAFFILPVFGNNPGCIEKISRALTASEWRILTRVESLDAASFSLVKSVSSASFKCKLPTKAGGDMYPRFRVDEYIFYKQEKIPLYDGSPLQVHTLKNGTASRFPARQYHLKSAGMSFRDFLFDYGYAIYRSFRVGNHVFIIYTDASAFIKYIDAFLQTIKPVAEQCCNPADTKERGQAKNAPPPVITTPLPANGKHKEDVACFGY